VLNVVHLKTAECKEFGRLRDFSGRSKLVISNPFMHGWRHIIVLTFLVLQNFWTFVPFFSLIRNRSCTLPV
jgi:hypothetical protein